MSLLDTAPTSDGVLAAAERLAGKAVKTPLLENAFLNERAGGRIFLKAENLQHCGAFKFRGAYNLMSQLTAEERAGGVVAWSSGNHGQGIALAAKMVGAPAVIVMPADAPAIKADTVRALGAEIVAYDRYKDNREAIAYEIARERGAIIAPSFDHPHIIEGQGTAALEAVEQAQAAGVSLDAMIVCCGGGGFASGCALGLSVVSPKTAIYIAEPEGYDDTARSLEKGDRVEADISRKTLCDAIATPSPGELTFPILKQYAKGAFVISEEQVKAAVSFAAQRLKLIVEPGGAVALAAILAGHFDAQGKNVAVTLSGGNIDPDVLALCLGTQAP